MEPIPVWYLYLVRSTIGIRSRCEWCDPRYRWGCFHCACLWFIKCSKPMSMQQVIYRSCPKPFYILKVNEIISSKYLLFDFMSGPNWLWKKSSSVACVCYPPIFLFIESILSASYTTSINPHRYPVANISYGRSHNLSPFLDWKIWLIYAISCIANCSYLTSSLDLTITLMRRQVFKWPKGDCFLTLSSC